MACIIVLVETAYLFSPEQSGTMRHNYKKELLFFQTDEI